MKLKPTAETLPQKLLKKSIILALLFILPFLMYLFRNIFVLGFIVPSLPTSNLSLLTSILFYNSISSSTSGSWISQLQWGNFISVWWFTTPFLIPILISLSSSIYRLRKRFTFNSGYVPILLFFVCLFMIWSTALLCDSNQGISIILRLS